MVVVEGTIWEFEENKFLPTFYATCYLFPRIHDWMWRVKSERKTWNSPQKYSIWNSMCAFF